MCSIGGFISDRPLPAATCQRLASALLFFGEERGRQSSGIYINNKLFKKAEAANKVVFSPAFAELFDAPASLCLVHNRQPTCGGQGDEQAHPFWVGNTVGIHNGWLTNCSELIKKWQLEKPSGVDSELLAAAMDKLGPLGFSKFMNDVSGNASVAMLHHGELYLGRDGNPLEYLNMDVEFSDGKTSVTLFGSTEPQVLKTFNHCWLLNSYRRTITLPQQKLFHISASGAIKDIGEFKTAPRTTVAYEGSRDDWGSEDYSHHFRRGRTYSTSDDHHDPALMRTGFRPQIKTQMKDNTFYVEIGGEEFSLSELLAIKGDPAIAKPTMSMPMGMRVHDGTAYPRYVWRYEIMQRVRYGDLQDVVTAAVKAHQFEKKQQTRLLLKTKKKKKNRNRNGDLSKD